VASENCRASKFQGFLGAAIASSVAQKCRHGRRRPREQSIDRFKGRSGPSDGCGYAVPAAMGRDWSAVGFALAGLDRCDTVAVVDGR
jgi:hypothetical protein